MKICPKCNKEFTDDNSFCGNCGVPLEIKPVYCTKCGHLIEAGQTFCGECGAKIPEDLKTLLKENLTQVGKKVRETLSDENVNRLRNTAQSILANENNDSANTSLSVIDKVVVFINGLLLKIIGFLPNLEKRFPTEESRYSAFKKIFYLGVISSMITFLCNILDNPRLMYKYPAIYEFLDEYSTIFSLIIISSVIISWIFAYTVFYIFVKSNVIKFILKLVLNIFIGLLICSALSLLIVPLSPILTIILAIIANKKRFAILSNYKSYVVYAIFSQVLPIVCFVMLVIILFIALLSGNTGRGLDFILSILLLVAFLAPIITMNYALNKEYKKGIPFLQFMRIYQTIPFVILLCLSSYLTMTRISGLSGDSIFGTEGTDFMIDNAEINSAEASSIPNNTQLNSHSATILNNNEPFNNVNPSSFNMDHSFNATTSNPISYNHVNNIETSNGLNENVGTVAKDGRVIGSIDNSSHNEIKTGSYPKVSTITIDEHNGIVKENGQIVGSADHFGGEMRIRNYNTGNVTTIDDHSGIIKENGQIVGSADHFGGETRIRNYNTGSITTIDDHSGTIRENGNYIGKVDNFGGESKITHTNLHTNEQHIYAGNANKPIDVVDNNPAGVTTIRSEYGGSGTYENGGVVRDQKTGQIVDDENIKAKYDLIRENNNKGK